MRPTVEGPEVLALYGDGTARIVVDGLYRVVARHRNKPDEDLASCWSDHALGQSSRLGARVECVATCTASQCPTKASRDRSSYGRNFQHNTARVRPAECEGRVLYSVQSEPANRMNHIVKVHSVAGCARSL